MKFFSFILLVTLSSNSLISFAQNDKYFEGVIFYDHQYISKSPTYDPIKMEKAIGNKSEFYFKNGDYRQVFTGEYMKMNLRKMEENKTYVQYANYDTIFWWDGAQKNEEVISSRIKDTAVKILNYKCKKLVIASNRLSGGLYTKREYLFSPELSINPDWYKECLFSSENIKFEKMKALPLKIIIEAGDGVMVMTATKVERKTLEASIFELPKDAITKKE